MHTFTRSFFLFHSFLFKLRGEEEILWWRIHEKKSVFNKLLLFQADAGTSWWPCNPEGAACELIEMRNAENLKNYAWAPKIQGHGLLTNTHFINVQEQTMINTKMCEASYFCGMEQKLFLKTKNHCRSYGYVDIFFVIWLRIHRINLFMVLLHLPV